MKIAVLNDAALQSSYLPGAPRRMKELVEGMSQKGWNVIIFNTYNICARTMFPRFLASFLEIMLSFLRLIRGRMSPQAIVFSSSLDGIVALFYRAFHEDIKIIYCRWGSSVKGVQLRQTTNIKDSFLKFLELSFIQFLEKMVCISSDKVIFDSRAGYIEAEKLAGKQLAKAQVIPNNANPSWVQKWLSEIPKASTIVNNVTTSWKNKKVIGFVGNLYEAGNGLDILLNAFKLVAKRIPESILVIVGDGPDKRILEQKTADLSLDNKVYFTGGVPNPLLYVKNFDVFVAPARHHSCPNAVLESLTCRVPVIGSHVGGIPEILKHEELLFTPDDSKVLASKLTKILTDKSYMKKIRQLTENLRNKHSFDWQKIMVSSIEETIRG